MQAGRHSKRSKCRAAIAPAVPGWLAVERGSNMCRLRGAAVAPGSRAVGKRQRRPVGKDGESIVASSVTVARCRVCFMLSWFRYRC